MCLLLWAYINIFFVFEGEFPETERERETENYIYFSFPAFHKTPKLCGYFTELFLCQIFSDPSQFCSNLLRGEENPLMLGTICLNNISSKTPSCVLVLDMCSRGSSSFDSALYIKKEFDIKSKLRIVDWKMHRSPQHWLKTMSLPVTYFTVGLCSLDITDF